MNSRLSGISHHDCATVFAEDIIEVEACTMAVAHTGACLRAHTGAGIAVCLYDRQNMIAGLNHFILPRTEDPQKATGRYGNAALIGLHRMLIGHGASMPLSAYIGGGAYSDEFELDAVLENIRVAWKFLFIMEIPLITQHIGGCYPREVQFNVATGVFSAKLRTAHDLP